MVHLYRALTVNGAFRTGCCCGWVSEWWVTLTITGHYSRLSWDITGHYYTQTLLDTTVDFLSQKPSPSLPSGGGSISSEKVRNRTLKLSKLSVQECGLGWLEISKRSWLGRAYIIIIVTIRREWKVGWGLVGDGNQDGEIGKHRVLLWQCFSYFLRVVAVGLRKLVVFIQWVFNVESV